MTNHHNTTIQQTKIMTTIPIDLTIELRSSDGMSMEYYQTDEESIREALRLLAAPQLFAQPHLLLGSQHYASMIPCKGIDMILVRTSAPLPLKFPLNLPVGQFDLVEQPEGFQVNNFTATEDRCERKPGQAHRHTSHLEIRTHGGWTVSLKAVAIIHGHVQDERQFFSRLPEVPTIPFRLQEGGFGLINTANITCASARPKPDVLPGTPLPLIVRRRISSARRGYEIAIDAD